MRYLVKSICVITKNIVQKVLEEQLCVVRSILGLAITKRGRAVVSKWVPHFLERVLPPSSSSHLYLLSSLSLPLYYSTCYHPQSAERRVCYTVHKKRGGLCLSWNVVTCFLWLFVALDTRLEADGCLQPLRVCYVWSMCGVCVGYVPGKRTYRSSYVSYRCLIFLLKMPQNVSVCVKDWNCVSNNACLHFIERQ